jgi:transcriptional regulator with XRE-family HTH domain
MHHGGRIYMSIGARIKLRRKELGYTADEVADRLGKNRATIYRYESDEIENLPLTILEPLAKVLQTSPEYLMGWNNNSETLKERNKSSKVTKLITAVSALNIKDEDLSEEDINNITQFIEFIRNKNRDSIAAVLNAAHEIPGSSKDANQHDEDLMDDDKIWG